MWARIDISPERAQNSGHEKETTVSNEAMLIHLWENKICWQRHVWFYTLEDECVGLELETANELVEHAPHLLSLVQPPAQEMVGPFPTEVVTEGFLILPMLFADERRLQDVKIQLEWLSGTYRLFQIALERIRTRPGLPFLVCIKDGVPDWGPPDMKSRPRLPRL